MHAARLPTNNQATWQRLIAGVAAALICGLAAQELYRLAPLSGTLMGKFSWKWFAAYLIFLTLLGSTLGAFLMVLFRPQRLEALGSKAIAFRARLGRLCRPAAVLAALLPPTLLLFTPLGDLFSGAFLRLLILLFSALLTGYLLTSDPTSVIGLKELAFGTVLAGGAHLFVERFSHISAYPFSTGWSEGNRLYDYSLIIDRSRYIIPDPSGLRLNAWGRNTLWGVPYLIPGAPIWLLRLWDALLWTLPYLALGWVIAGWVRLPKMFRLTLALWVVLFLFQGPVYTPLVLSALLVAWAVRPERRAVSPAAAAISSFYAAASRWTWLSAPAGWAGMILLDDYNPPASEPFVRSVRRLVPAAVATLAGLIGGMLADDRLFSPAELKSSTSLSQPLLWYRLLPNINYPQGLIFGLLIAVVPVIGLLVWLAQSRRWRLNRLQAAAYIAAAAVFLVAGLIASVKIGGGNNLHNLDMFLITLAVLTGLALKSAARAPLHMDTLPTWTRVLLLLAVLLPAWNAARLVEPRRLPDNATVQQSLQQIQARLSRGQKRGEVLFIDQRQLLTFGSVSGISLVPEYEKKLMMDRAMAGNKSYFEAFYRDLAAGRFAMIISEPLFDNMQVIETGFQEENNAWVEWVARPILCFYAPVETFSEVRTQILVPKTHPQGCEQYLEQSDS